MAYTLRNCMNPTRGSAGSVFILLLILLPTLFLGGIYAQKTYWTPNDYAIGYAAGYTAGNSTGNRTGYLVGHQVGYTTGNSSGYIAGYAAGYSDGYTNGYSAGYYSGYAAGVSSVTPISITNITTVMPSAAIMMNDSSTLGGLSNVALEPNGTLIDVAPSTEYVVPFTVPFGEVLKTINLFCQITEGLYATLNCYIIPTKNWPEQLQTNWGNNLFRELVIQNNASIPMQFTTFLENDSYYLCLESAGPAHFNFPLSDRNASYPKYQDINGSLIDTGRTLAIEYIYQSVTFHPGIQQILNVESYSIKFTQGVSLDDPDVTLGAPSVLTLTTNTNLTLAYLNIKLVNDYSGSSLGSFTFGSNTVNNFAISTYQFTPNSATTITILNATLYTFTAFHPYLIVTILFNGTGSAPITHQFSAYWDYDAYTAAPQTTFRFTVPNSSPFIGDSISEPFFIGDPIPNIVNFTDEIITFGLVPENIWETCAANGWYDQVVSNYTSIEVFQFGTLMLHEYPNSYQIQFPDGFAIVIIQCDTFVNWQVGGNYGNGYNQDNTDQGGYAAPVFVDNDGQAGYYNPVVCNGLVFGNQTTYQCSLTGLHFNSAMSNNNGGTGDIDYEQYNFNGMILTDNNMAGMGVVVDPIPNAI